jgi:hypothetical protein
MEIDMAHKCRHSYEGCKEVNCDCGYARPDGVKMKCQGCIACQMMIETDKERRDAGLETYPRYSTQTDIN